MSYDISILEEITLPQEKIDLFLNSTTLSKLILNVMQLAFTFSRSLIEFELTRRAKEKTIWGHCPKCGSKLESRGFLPRTLYTLIGSITWKRRVGRCSRRCKIGQIVPFDSLLGISPYQKTMVELKEMTCLLAIFMPYRVSALIFKKLLGLPIGVTTIWTWVQKFGKTAMQQLQKQIDDFKQTGTCVQEPMEKSISQLQCLLGADGVFAPFRPNGGSPKGKVVWKEIKIGVITRMKSRFNKKGQRVTELVQRKLVAVLGDVSLLVERLQLETHKQRIDQSIQTVWISDGGRWLWNIYENHYAKHVVGVLDFYHAAQNLWKGTAAWLDARTKTAKKWFIKARHKLRHGDITSALEEFEEALKGDLSDEKEKTIKNAKNYLTEHLEEIQYAQFKQQNIPIGSGFVESACKWLIQQRFKCVGMRWSEEGFSHLLHLRLLWVNDRWDTSFPRESPNM